MVLPYFLGEKTPIFDADARGVISGLSLGHGRGHLFRAMLEAVAAACIVRGLSNFYVEAYVT